MVVSASSARASASSSWRVSARVFGPVGAALLGVVALSGELGQFALSFGEPAAGVFEFDCLLVSGYSLKCRVEYG